MRAIINYAKFFHIIYFIISYAIAPVTKVLKDINYIIKLY